MYMYKQSGGSPEFWCSCRKGLPTSMIPNVRIFVIIRYLVEHESSIFVMKPLGTLVNSCFATSRIQCLIESRAENPSNLSFRGFVCIISPTVWVLLVHFLVLVIPNPLSV